MMFLLSFIGILISTSILQVVCNRCGTQKYSPVSVLLATKNFLKKVFQKIGGVYAWLMQYVTFYWVFEFIIEHYHQLYEFIKRGLRRLRALMSSVWKVIIEVCTVSLDIMYGLLGLLTTPAYVIQGYYNEITTYKYYPVIRYLSWILTMTLDYWNDSRVFSYLYETFLGTVILDVYVCSAYTLFPYYNYLIIKILLIASTVSLNRERVMYSLAVILGMALAVPGFFELCVDCQGLGVGSAGEGDYSATFIRINPNFG